MIKIKNVTIRNFLSIGQQTQAVDLSSSGLTLVLGKNSDIGATNSRNGVGKSAFVQAVSFALFGLPITNIKRDNLINNINQKSMLVTIDFEKDGKNYRIERGRKPNILRFLVNNKEASSQTDEAQGENKQTQTEIERILGMTHTMFRHVVALNTFTQPFLLLKPADQREVIEELLGITQLSLRDENLKKLIIDTKEIIRNEEASVKAISEANDRINRAIDRAIAESRSWDIAQKSKINKMAEHIESIGDIDFEKELNIFDKIDEWSETFRELKTKRTILFSEKEVISKENKNILDQINRLKDSASSNIESQLIRLRSEIKRCENEASKEPDVQRLLSDAKRRENDAAAQLKIASAKEIELKTILKEIENSDGHSCSTCGQDLNGTEHLEKVMANLAQKTKIIENEIAKCFTDAGGLQKEADEIYEEIENVKALYISKQKEWIDKANDIRNEIVEVETQKKLAELEINSKILEMEKDRISLQEVLVSYDSDIKEIDKSIQILGEKPISSFKNKEEIWKLRESKDKLLDDLKREIEKENPHFGHIASLKSTIQIISYDALNEAQTILKHQDFLHKLLSGKDSFVRKKIIDQNLSYLNNRLNYYLEALGLPHEVRFLPDLSVEISMLGRDFDFEQLSRGEMNRVILATSWSFRDVWESMNTSLNLLLVDENLDTGTDENGVDACLEILNSMARKGKSIFLISHKESLMSRVGQILLVQKSNNFTAYEANAEVI